MLNTNSESRLARNRLFASTRLESYSYHLDVTLWKSLEQYYILPFIYLVKLIKRYNPNLTLKSPYFEMISQDPQRTSEFQKVYLTFLFKVPKFNDYLS